MNWLNSPSISMLNKSLDGVWARQQAISDNIANYQTPGYKRKYVSFEEELKAAIANDEVGIKKTKSQLSSDISDSKVLMGVADNEDSRADGNSINLEYENIELTRAQLQYRALSQQMSARFAGLRAAISGASR